MVCEARKGKSRKDRKKPTKAKTNLGHSDLRRFRHDTEGAVTSVSDAAADWERTEVSDRKQGVLTRRMGKRYRVKKGRRTGHAVHEGDDRLRACGEKVILARQHGVNGTFREGGNEKTDSRICTAGTSARR